MSTENKQKNVSFKEIMSCKEYFSQLEIDRSKKVARMKKLFESIGPTLIKLESLILGTFTGQSSKMKQYYVFWEKETFALLIKYYT